MLAIVMRLSIRNSLFIALFVGVVTGIYLISVSVSRKHSGSKHEKCMVHDHHHSHPVPEMEESVLDPAGEQVLHDFQSWMASYRSGQTDEAFRESGKRLAEQRRPLMVQLIKRDPQAALEAAIGYADFHALPEDMKALLEQPFTTTGEVRVTAVCDHESHTPEYLIDVYLEDGERLRTGDGWQWRSGQSKSEVPLQGIELAGWTAIKPTVFDRVEGADADWAWENLPSGNPDPTVDFFTGEALGSRVVTAVAGGFSFLFANETTLAAMEDTLKEFDQMAGAHTGSSVLFSDEVQEIQGKGFPIEAIRESQQQIAIDDTTGEKTTIFIRVVFSDKPDAPISKEDLESQINVEVSAHLMDFSFNQTSMVATATTGTYLMSKTSDQYTFDGAGGTIDTQGTIDEAIALYEAAGSPDGALAGFDIVGVIFPKLESWGSGAGLGTVGGANSQHWLNGTPSTETILHEYGHNYGLKHSNYWDFKKNGDSSNPVEDEPIGENVEYGDLWDVMGDGDAIRGHFHMAAKRYLRWLEPGQVMQIDEEAESGTYRIYRFDHVEANEGLQGLEIKKSDDENYWIGFRRAFESNPNYYRGAYILWERSSSAQNNKNAGDPGRNQGWIIDTTPDSEAERQDAGISLGRTYSDPAAGVHITPVAVGGSGADTYLDVVVNYGNFDGNNTPTINSLNVPSTGDARTPITLSVDGGDQDEDALAYSWDLGNGEVYDSAPSVNVTFTVGGTYDVAVTISDMKGGVITQSAQIEIADPVNNWSSRNYGSTNDLFALARNGGHVVAGGKSTLLRSADGETWASVGPGGNEMLNVSINGICWTGSEFIAVGHDYDFGVQGWKGIVYTSPAGETWTKVFEAPALAGGSNNGFTDVATNEDGSLVILVGDRDLVYKRVDGGEWTQVDLGLSTQTDLGITYGSGVFVLGGFDFTNQQEGLYLFRTDDGTNWEDLVDNSDLNPNSGLDDLYFFNDLFIGSGFNSRTVFSENRGISWQTLQKGNRHDMHAFAFGNGVFYGIGEDSDDGGALINLVSSDGKIWKQVASGVVEPGNAIIFFNNSFIIAGGERFDNQDNGFIRQSDLILAAAEVVADPVFAPGAQSFSDSVTVNISTSTQDARIRYTLDGSDPTELSSEFLADLVITDSTTVKARGFKDGADPSAIVSATYTKIQSGFEAWIASFQLEGDDAEANANPDGDWAANLVERAVGSLPNDGESAPPLPELSFDETGKAVFRIYRLTKSPDVVLSVEKSTDMKSWSPLAATATSDTDTLLEITSTEGVSQYPCFFRIKAVE